MTEIEEKPGVIMSYGDSVRENTTAIDPRKADALYRPFPSFEEWSTKCAIDPTRWDRYTGELRRHRQASPDLLPRALEIVRRAAAFDTGAIEGLYETDRGFTITVALQC